MNTQRIEGKGVTTINEFVFNSSILIPHIEFNDRTDSWDGFIFVYSDDTNEKSNLLGRIPVQVKTSNVKQFSGKTKSMAFEVPDLINYRNDGGVIIFCVDYCSHNRKIYYTSLLPYDLEQLLKGLKSKQKTKNITLKQIQMNNLSKLEQICREFLMHRKHQFSLPCYDFPYNKVKEFMMQGVKPVNVCFEEMLLSHPHYLYGKTHSDSPLYDCVTKINIEEIKKTLDKPVSVGSREFYTSYNVIALKDKVQLFFGKNVSFTIEKHKLRIHYSCDGKLDNHINDMEFIANFIESKAIKISGVEIPLLTSNLEKEKEQEELWKIKNRHKYLVNISALLDIFKIPHDKIDLNSISNDDLKVLELLISVMVLNNPVPKQKTMPAKYYFKFGNISILTIIHQNANSKILMEDISAFSQGKLLLFPDNVNQNENPAGMEVSVYLLLDSDDILCSNIRINEVVVSVISYQHTYEYDNRVLSLALEIIKAYDKTGTAEYLNCANTLLTWLGGEFVDESIININKLQIVRRHRELNKQEKDYLESLKEKEKSKTAIMCGISILLGDVKNFNYYFETLPTEQKKDFSNYPIYTLLNQSFYN